MARRVGDDGEATPFDPDKLQADAQQTAIETAQASKPPVMAPAAKAVSARVKAAAMALGRMIGNSELAPGVLEAARAVYDRVWAPMEKAS